MHTFAINVKEKESSECETGRCCTGSVYRPPANTIFFSHCRALLHALLICKAELCPQWRSQASGESVKTLLSGALRRVIAIFSNQILQSNIVSELGNEEKLLSYPRFTVFLQDMCMEETPNGRC